MITHILESTVSLATFLIIIIGCLVTICLLLYPIYFLIDNILYQRMKASVYFLSFLKHKKAFLKWEEERKPTIYKPNIKK